MASTIGKPLQVPTLSSSTRNWRTCFRTPSRQTRYQAPLVAWRTYADLGRLQAQHGDPTAAQSSFKQAAEIVMACAANVNDSDLRATFLSSTAVREVIAGAADHPPTSQIQNQ